MNQTNNYKHMIYNNIIVIMSIFLCIGCCCTKKSLSKEEQIEKARQEAQEKADKAKREARLARCGDNYNDVELTCNSLIKAKLFRPDTASFSLMFDRVHDVNEDCSERYGNTVEAKNAYGQNIKYFFTCAYNPKTKIVSVTSFIIR